MLSSFAPAHTIGWFRDVLFWNLSTVKHSVSVLLGLSFGLMILCGAPAHAEEHRATRLGHPATRFAPPLHTPEDLRSRFRDEKLRPDIASILRQWGWTGNLEDLHRAALTAEIVDGKILVGTGMPFMSSRKDGTAICLRNVIWAGAEPVGAYAFTFSSKGRRYRCVTPKPCSNFFLEDLGPEPTPVPLLALTCSAPPREFTGRTVKVCLTLQNKGDGPEAKTTIALPIPAGATVVSATEGGITSLDRVTWGITDLAKNGSREVCAVFTTERPGRMEFKAAAQGAVAGPAYCESQTQILGVYAVLVEVVDLEDPIEVGKAITYVVTVTNQGNQTGTGIRVVCTVPDSQEFVFGTGTTAVQAQGRTVSMSPLPSLDGKAVATWRVMTKALRADDSRFKVDFTTDQFEKPIRREESTRLY